MVFVKISGGLGNQLFQYFFGKYLESKLNTTVKYDIRTLYNLNSFTNRDFVLHTLNLPITIADKRELREVYPYNSVFLNRIKRKIAQVMPFVFSKYIVESKLHFPLKNKYLKDNCYYEGYWQSFYYILNSNTDFCNTIIKVKLQTDKAIMYKSLIQQSQSVAIHVRRGDYISIVKNHRLLGVCDIEYYIKSIDFISKKISDPKFFIFSDDIEWCRINFIGSQFIFVSNNSQIDDLLLMTMCKHNIIANSTYSWWGAWLNCNNSKIIISPKIWYNQFPKINLTEFIPCQWLQI